MFKTKTIFGILVLSASLIFADVGYKSNPITVFGGNGINYRIPSMVVTNKGRILIVSDKRYQGLSDWNNIDNVLRYSDDLGETFSVEKSIVNLPGGYRQGKSAFTIDASMLTTGNETLLLVDMFPKSQGLLSVVNNEGGSGFEKIDNRYYQKLKKYGENTNYLISEQGDVYRQTSEKLEPTNLKVRVAASGDFHELGDIYENGKKIGNIYRGRVNDDVDEMDYDGDYMVLQTSYLFLTRTSDSGETFSSPLVISKNLKEKNMSFLGTGPGNGIKLEHGPNKGRLIFPVYFTTTEKGNNSQRVDLESQQTALIYSDDNGYNWKLSESIMENRVVKLPYKDEYITLNKNTPKLGGFQLTESQIVELNSGTLKIFMRGFHDSIKDLGGGIHIGTSKDGGKTFENVTEEFPYEAPYSQVSAIHYGNIGEDEFIILAAPSDRKRRINGKVYLGKVKENDSIEWIANREFNSGSTQYSSLAVLPDGDIAILYEVGESSVRIDFSKFSIDWLAPNYNFKTILPFPKNYVENLYRDRVIDRTSKILNTANLNRLYEKNMKFNYTLVKDGNFLIHNIDVSTPIIDGFGLYSKLSTYDKSFNLGFGTYYAFDTKYVRGHQSLGYEYLNELEYKDRIRNNNLTTKFDLHSIRLNTQVNFLTPKVNYFTFNPNISLDLLTVIKSNGEVNDEKGNNISLKSNGVLVARTNVGLDINCNYKDVALNLDTNFVNEFNLGNIQDKLVGEYKPKLEISSGVKYNLKEDASVYTNISFLGNLKNIKDNNISFSLGFNKKW